MRKSFKLVFLLLVHFVAAPILAAEISLAQLSLTDYNGKPFAHNSLKGHPILLNFVFTGCSVSCSMQTSSLSKIRRALPVDVISRIKFVTVSLDSMADTPSVLKQYAIKHDAFDPGWWFLHAEPPALAKLLRQVEGSRADATQKNTATHSGILYLISADGSLIQRYMGFPPNENRLNRELTQLARTQK